MDKTDFNAHLISNTLSSNSKKSYTLSNEGFYGEKKGEKINYSLSEGLFLMKKKNLKIFSGKKEISETEAISKFSKIDKKFPTKYKVYEDLRSKGFILKSGIKYGADFTIYSKGEKPGKNHSKWILYVESYSQKLRWEELVLKNRVANSTNKKVLIAIEDEEGNIVYYEMNWKKI